MVIILSLVRISKDILQVFPRVSGDRYVFDEAGDGVLLSSKSPPGVLKDRDVLVGVRAGL